MSGSSGSKIGLGTPKKWLAKAFLFTVLCCCAVVHQAVAATNESWAVAVPVGNVRQAPEADAPLVAQLPAGTRVTELERQGSWLKVRLPEGDEAWMHQVTLSQSVELFGLSLQTADRSSLRSAIQAARVAVVREVDSYPYDLYDPGDWMAGATEMAVGYTRDSQLFAVAEITFRSFDDTEQVRQVAEQVRNRLGPWQRVSGRRAEGPVEFEWRLGDLRVLVHRGWPDTTTYLTYEVPSRVQLLQSQLNGR